MTKVVNVKTDKYDIYIGRQMGFDKYPQSIYHNPFKTGSLGCENVGMQLNYIITILCLIKEQN
jgi:hypothetical protein